MMLVCSCVCVCLQPLKLHTMHESVEVFSYETINLLFYCLRPWQGGLVHTSVRFPSPGQHSDGPLHILVATAVPFCPHGAPQAPDTHEDQPTSPANKLYNIHKRYCLNVRKS